MSATLLWVVLCLCTLQHAAAALHVCTFATHRTPGFCQTLKSLLYNQLNLTVAGWLRNSSELGSYQGKLGKVPGVLGCLQHIRKNDPQGIVLAIDAFDVLFQKGAHDLLAHLHVGIMFNAEKNCYPIMHMSKVKGWSTRICDLYETATPSHITTAYAAEHKEAPRFINSGLIMGRVDHMLHWYEKLILLTDSAVSDDQHASLLLHWIGDKPVMLDYGSAIFQTMSRSVTDVAQNEKYGLYRNIITNSTPAILHFNGDKSPIIKFADNMWYNKPGGPPLDGSRGFTTVDGHFVSYDSVC
jgi:hypothetical protein